MGVKKYAILLVTLVGIFFFFFLQEIPYEQETTVVAWKQATKMTWTKVLGYTINPVSRSRTADDLTLIQDRPVEHLILKAIYNFFGDSIQAVFWYNIGLAILFSVMVLWFASKVVGLPPFIGFMTSIWLVLTPAYTITVMEFGDFSPLDQILLIGYLWVLLASINHFGFMSLLLVPLGFLAVRCKETNLFLVPLLSWWMMFYYRKRLKDFWPVIPMLLVVTLPLILVRDNSQVVFSWLAPLRVLIYNPRWYGDGSIFATLGWALALFAVVFIFLGLKERSEIRHLLIGWCLLALAFYFNVSLSTWNRYLVILLLPVSLLTARAFYQINPGNALAVILIILLTSASIGVNVHRSFMIRKALQTTWLQKLSFRLQRYYQKTGNPSPTLFQLYDSFESIREIPR